MDDFFSFRQMVSFKLIKILYVIGMIYITISSLISIGKGMEANYGDTIIVLTGIGSLVLGNLVWRIMCELWIVMFSIHDNLISIDKKFSSQRLETKGEGIGFTAPTADVTPSRSTTPVVSTKTCKNCEATIQVRKADVSKGYGFCDKCGYKYKLA